MWLQQKYQCYKSAFTVIFCDPKKPAQKKKTPTCNKPKPSVKKKKANFWCRRAGDLSRVGCDTVSSDKQFLPPCSPMMAPWSCKSRPRKLQTAATMSQCCSNIQELKQSSYSSNKCMSHNTRQEFVWKMVFPACTSSLTLPSQSAYLIPHTKVLRSAVTSGNTSCMAL